MEKVARLISIATHNSVIVCDEWPHSHTNIRFVSVHHCKGCAVHGGKAPVAKRQTTTAAKQEKWPEMNESWQLLQWWQQNAKQSTHRENSLRINLQCVTEMSGQNLFAYLFLSSLSLSLCLRIHWSWQDNQASVHWNNSNGKRSSLLTESNDNKWAERTEKDWRKIHIYLSQSFPCIYSVNGCLCRSPATYFNSPIFDICFVWSWKWCI